MTASCAVLDFLRLFEPNMTDALATWIEIKVACPGLEDRCPTVAGVGPVADVATVALIASLLSSALLCPPAERLKRALARPVSPSNSDGSIPVNEMTAHLLGFGSLDV